MPIVGAPDLEQTFGTAHAALALVVFLVPGLIALAVEPAIFLLADRYPRRWFIRTGVAVMAAGVFVAAAAPGPWTFSLALSIVWIASGVSSSLAQATLVDRWPDQRGKTLARWTLWSLGGDLVAPALLAVLALAGFGWRVGLALVGALLFAWFVALVLLRDPDDTKGPPVEDEQTPSLLEALRDALKDRVLVGWLFGATLCDLLDEILVVFASLHLRIELGAGPVWQDAVIASMMIGGALGLFVLEKLLRVRSERWLLAASAIGTVVTYVPWLAAPTPWLSMLLALPVGAFSSVLYPLTAAQAYARRPDASGSVLAAGHLFTPLGLAFPFALGAIADATGTTVALALLALQPLGLLVLVATTRR